MYFINEMTKKGYLETPIGVLEICVKNDKIKSIQFCEKKGKEDKDKLIEKTKKELKEYFEGKRKEFDLPVDFEQFTESQKKVYKSLLRVKYGEVTTYSTLGKECFLHPRAVGQILKRNCVFILIPCHRVVDVKGNLRGFSAGLWRKKYLLELEKKK